MAWSANYNMTAERQAKNCGGLRRMPERGTKTISGTTKIDGLPASCRVFLHTADGTLISFMRTPASGVYSFIGLYVGDYRLVIEDDRQTLRRSKVEHVTVT